MNKECDGCKFLEKPDPKTQILTTKYWTVGLGNNQAYFGRAYASLLTHKGSLGSLSKEEWEDFEMLVKRIEEAYKAVFGAEPLNWGCYMNLAFRKKPFKPHVHWHIYPRYAVAPVFDGVIYEDSLFGSFYDNDIERIVDDKVVERIALKLSGYLASH